jgi:hypothetical protein
MGIQLRRPWPAELVRGRADVGYLGDPVGHGDMIRLLRRCGLEVADLLELRPGPDATASHPLATIEWARQWPCEEVWKARKVHRA